MALSVRRVVKTELELEVLRYVAKKSSEAHKAVCHQDFTKKRKIMKGFVSSVPHLCSNKGAWYRNALVCVESSPKILSVA